jgi:hypothetical protein
LPIWEYKVYAAPDLPSVQSTERRLNAIGRDGWELVAVTGQSAPQYVLKRRERSATNKTRDQVLDGPIDKVDIARRLLFLFEAASPSIKARFESAIEQNASGEITNEQMGKRHPRVDGGGLV